MGVDWFFHLLQPTKEGESQLVLSSSSGKHRGESQLILSPSMLESGGSITFYKSKEDVSRLVLSPSPGT